MSVNLNVETCRIVAAMRSHRDAAWWIVFPHKQLAHKHNHMSFWLFCDNTPGPAMIALTTGLALGSEVEMLSPRVLFYLMLAAACPAGAAYASAASAPLPCASNPARQLDFWLGTWSVDSGRGRSDVQLSLDKCQLVESWASNTSDHRGQNTIAYNSEDKVWYGLFVDNPGRAHMLSGTVSDGSAEFQGPGRDEDGMSVLKRVRIVRVNPQTVDQIWEKSTDNGATWTTDFKMEYLRKAP